jgi:hypothetical protein
LVVATACGGTPPAVEAPTAEATAKRTYAVRFARASRAGERSHVVADHREDSATTITREGALVSEKHVEHAVHFDAVSTVVAADPQGRATRLRYDVKELSSDGQQRRGSVIELTRHAKKTDAEILVDGSLPSDDTRKVLSSLFKLGLEGATDDDVFGTKTPQPIGAHWTVDSARAIASFKEDGLDVATVKGDVSLDGTTSMDGAECLVVRATLEISGVGVPGLPPGSEPEDSHGTAEIRATLPIDERAGVSAEHEAMTMSFRVRVPAPRGAPMIVSVKNAESNDVRETPK